MDHIKHSWADTTQEQPVCELFCTMAAERIKKCRGNLHDRLWPEDDGAKHGRLEPYSQRPRGKTCLECGILLSKLIQINNLETTGSAIAESD